MSIPTHQQIMLPLLKLYSDNTVHYRADFYNEIAKYFKLSEDDLKLTISSGRNKLLDRILWAITFLKTSGLIGQTKRGCYQISKRGLEFLKEHSEIKELSYEIIKQLYPDVMETPFWNPKLRQSRGTIISTSTTESDLTPDEQLSQIVEQKKLTIYAELEDQIKRISPKAFEKLVVKLLIAMGYGTEEFSQVTQYSNDGGIDGIIQADKLGFRKIYVQAKRYLNNNVGRAELQSFVGAMGKVHEGIFITTSKFNNNALEYIRDISQKVILIDMAKLVELMHEYNQGVSVREIVELKGIDGDYFDELES